MNIGNIVVSFVRESVNNFTQSANQMVEEVFTNPGQFIEEVQAGAKHALNNRVYELASSSALILGSGIAGVVLAKKAYSHNGRVVTRIALGLASAAFFAAAAYETCTKISQLRLSGECLNLANEAGYLKLNSKYMNLGCFQLLNFRKI